MDARVAAAVEEREAALQADLDETTQRVELLEKRLRRAEMQPQQQQILIDTKVGEGEARRAKSRGYLEQIDGSKKTTD